MSRPVKILAIVIAALLLLMLGSWLAVRALFSDSTKQKLLTKLSTAAGVPVQVGEITVDFGQFVKLQPAITLRKVVLGNPRDFKSPSMLEADELQAKADIRSIISGNPDVQRIAIIHPVITIERNVAGATNIQTLISNLGKQSSAPGEAKAADSSAEQVSPGQISIDEFEITGGEVNAVGMAELGGDKLVLLKNLNYSLTGFAPGKPVKSKLEADLYGGKVSEFTFDGVAGPLAENSIPTAGKATLKIALAELPPAIVKQFGTLLQAPGPDSIVTLAADLKGDVYGRLAGPVELALDKVSIGPDARHTMVLAGKTKGQLAVSQLLTTPSYAVQLPDADIQFGPGRLKAKVDFAAAGTLMEGSSAGSISGVDVRQFQQVFAPKGMKASGTLTVPRYALKFSGNNPGQIMDSLRGDGSLDLAKGYIEGMDVIASIKSAIDNPRAAGSGSGGNQTDFASLKAQFALARQTVTLSNIALESSTARIRGNGSINAAQALSFKLDAFVTGNISQLLGKSPSEEAHIPVLITGNTANPVVRPEIKSMAVETGINYLNKFLGGKLGKKK